MAPRATSAKSQANPKDSEGAVITNEALLLHAEASKLAKSWLKGTAFLAEADDDRDDAALELDEKRFALGSAQCSETGGVGFVVEPDAAAGSLHQTSRAADPTTTFLRKHLLGGGQQRGGPPRGGPPRGGHMSQKPRPTSKPSRLNDSDDDHEGRSGMVGKKGGARAKYKLGGEKNGGQQHTATHPATSKAAAAEPAAQALPKNNDLDDGEEGSNAVATATTEPPASTTHPPSKKRNNTSYLDEILAARAAKKNKKKKFDRTESG